MSCCSTCVQNSWAPDPRLRMALPPDDGLECLCSLMRGEEALLFLRCIVHAANRGALTKYSVLHRRGATIIGISTAGQAPASASGHYLIGWPILVSRFSVAWRRIARWTRAEVHLAGGVGWRIVRTAWCCGTPKRGRRDEKIQTRFPVPAVKTRHRALLPT
jgi:hypothetical protein